MAELSEDQPMPGANAAIAVEGLVKRFGDVTAINGTSFEVASGTITALLGGNGAGKTTTLAILLGLIEPDDGKVSVLGHDLLANRYAVLGRMNFESPYVNLPMRLTVRQNLTVFGRLYGVDHLKDRIGQVAEDLDLIELLDRPTGQLSAGQKTRAGLAKALINSPDILLLDEPTASLDPETADWVRAHLDQYRKSAGATILLASHNMSEVERLCDQVIMMRAGQIIDTASPRALIRKYGRQTLEEVFLDMARGTETIAPEEAAS